MTTMAIHYDLVVFDWDGTLMDSTGLIADCIRLAAQDLQFPVPTVQDAKQIIGLGLLPSLSLLFPRLSELDQQAFVARFREHYLPRDHEALLYTGVAEMLENLAAPERCLAVATGKPRRGLERAFEHSGLRYHFHFSRCGDEGFAKPHPDMLLKLMKFSGADASRTLMIGDTTHDMLMAQSAGVAAVGVAYGAHPRDALLGTGALAVVDHVHELAAWLTTHA